jgi:hypothetical protein
MCAPKNSNDELVETINKQGRLIETMMVKIEELSQKPISNHNTINNTLNNNRIVNNITILNILKNNYNDVISFEEFLENINVNMFEIQSIKDVETCIESLDRILVKNLKEYDICHRPLHCITDDDCNTETYLKNNEWIHEYIKDWDENMPVLDKKIFLFFKKVNDSMENMPIDPDQKTNVNKLLIKMKERINLGDLKINMFDNMNLNKYELNHTLLDNNNKNIIINKN